MSILKTPLRVENGNIVQADGTGIGGLENRAEVREEMAHRYNVHEELVQALEDCVAQMSGQPKSCGHAFECVCVGKAAQKAIAAAAAKSAPLRAPEVPDLLAVLKAWGLVPEDLRERILSTIDSRDAEAIDTITKAKVLR